MAGYNIQVTGIEELAAALKGIESKLARNVATAINKTKKKAVTFASRELRKEIPVPSRVLKKLLTNKSSANPNKLYARFVVWSGHPIPLRYFAAKQTKAGVTYRRTKADKGRMIARDAFIIRKGGRVYKRVGKARGPLEQVFGPSPGQFFQPTNLEAKLQPFISKQLPLEMKERVRVALLRQSGIIKQRKGV
jgi:hypothetical protein